jgi:tRNA-dihydrouridine synthase
MAFSIIICPKIILFLCRCLLYYVDIFELMIGNEIHFAPIQGYTDNEYRNVHSAFLGGVDYYYTPYLSVENNGKVKLLADIDRVSDPLKPHTIPQLLPANVAETKTIADHIARAGFKMVNLNLGCPYPMVTRRGRGAALIGKPRLVAQMVDMLIGNYGFSVSLKMRSGLVNEHEIFTFLDCFPHKKGQQIILHPRVASQLYKGKANVENFGRCRQLFPEIDFVYNGDIVSVSSFKLIAAILPGQQKWMIGRGLLLNPALAFEIKNEEESTEHRQEMQFIAFARLLVAEIEQQSSDKEHALNRAKIQLKMLFANVVRLKQMAKRIQKSRSSDEIKSLLNEASLI